MGRAASQKRVRGIVFLVKKEAVGHELNHLRAFHKRRRRVNEATPLSLIYGLISAVCEVLCIFRAVPVNSALPDVSDALCDLDKKKKTTKKQKCASLHLNLIVILMFSSLFFHIARTPFPCRFKPTPSGHLHSEEICISKNNEKLGYMYLDIISAVGQPAL